MYTMKYDYIYPYFPLQPPARPFHQAPFQFISFYLSSFKNYLCPLSVMETNCLGLSEGLKEDQQLCTQ